jgi:septal ring factor EnvC (AmiA/AmiB activator)
MKDEEKTYKRKSSFFILHNSSFIIHSLLVLFVFCTVFLPSFSYAASPHEEYNKIQKEMKTHKEKLEAAKRRESSILSDLESTSRQLRDVEDTLKKYKNQLSTTESTIAQVENDIARNKSTIDKLREWIRRKLRVIHRYGLNSEVFMLFLSAEDISELVRTGKYLQYITAYEHGILKTYKGTLESLTEKEKQLTSLRKELSRNKEKVQAEEESLEEKKNKKESLLATVKKEKNTHTRMLREMEESSQRLLDIIRESEKSEKAKEETFSTKSFAGLKGKLPWPVDGKVAIPYGSQKDPQFNTPIFRSGSYIKSNADAVAKAVHPGKVVFAEWFKGYGQLVIVNHGDGYHTLYGSLSEIFTKVGDIIKGKQAVGRVGSSGLLNAPGLYFELRYKGKPIDPAQWLQRR